MEKEKVKAFVESAIENTDCYLTDLKISGDNDIIIEIDSDTSIDIDFCSDLSRKFEEEFPRDVEDYTLEVGSAGLTSPFKVRRQWEKNLGNDIEVVTADGRKLKGELVKLNEDSFVIASEQKVKEEGAKKPVKKLVETEIPFTQVKRACYDLVF